MPPQLPPQSGETRGILLASSSNAIAFRVSLWFAVSVVLFLSPALGLLWATPALTRLFLLKFPALVDSLTGALVLVHFYCVVSLFMFGELVLSSLCWLLH